MFSLSPVEVEGTNKTSNRGKKFILERKELNNIEISAKGESRFGVFSAAGKNKYEFVNRENKVDWTILVKGQNWELEHKQTVIGNVSVNAADMTEYDFNFNGNQRKYGSGVLKISFNENNTQFKIDRVGAKDKEPRFTFAVFRSDDKTPVGQGSGKVEIAQKEKRNFVLVLASLFLFVRMSLEKSNKRASMPEARILHGKPTIGSPSKGRARSNSVDENKSPKSGSPSKKSDKYVPKKVKEDDKSPKKDKKDDGKKKRKHDSDDDDDFTDSDDDYTSSEEDETESHKKSKKPKKSTKAAEKKEAKKEEKKETVKEVTKEISHEGGPKELAKEEKVEEKIVEKKKKSPTKTKKRKKRKRKKRKKRKRRKKSQKPTKIRKKRKKRKKKN